MASDPQPPDDPASDPLNFFSPEAAAEPQPLYRRVLRECPVGRSSAMGQVVISDYEDVVWALRHPEVFSSEMEMQMALGTERPMIPQQIDPPAQTRFRKLLDPRFSRKRMLEIEPSVRADAHALIDRFIDAGECEFDGDFAVPLPCNAFLHLMGLPPEELPTFLAMKDGIIRPQMQSDDPTRAGEIRQETGQRIYAYFKDLIAQRRADPRDDLMTYLVTCELDGDRLSDEEVQDICFLMLLAGLDTVTATLGCSIVYLAQHPDRRQAVLDDPARLSDAIEELMRWQTPVTAVPRVCKQDVTVGGVEIRAGEMVTLLLGASNLDDAEFGRGDVVDFDRTSNRHLAFGAGAHRCLGSHLARMELRAALEVWHERIPHYRIKEGETPTYSPGIREVQYLPLVWDR